MMQRFILAVFVSLAVLGATYAETTCQSHQKASRNNRNHPLVWNIQCDAEGNYHPPLQCTNHTEKEKWCTCYNKEEACTGPSRNLRYCGCPLAKFDAQKRNAGPCDTPQCMPNGKFNTTQCCATTNKCNCVNPDTGAKTTEPTNNPNLNCPTA